MLFAASLAKKTWNKSSVWAWLYFSLRMFDYFFSPRVVMTNTHELVLLKFLHVKLLFLVFLYCCHY